MPLWRRREPLHERLAREGGLLAPEPSPTHPALPLGGAGVHGMARPREWDATVLVEASDLSGEEAVFVALSDGTLLVEEGPEPLPLAEALAGRIERPYRARAVRRAGSLWAVGARRIEVARLPSAPGEEIELTVHEGERSLRIDGRPTTGLVPDLERLAADRRLASYALYAFRLEGDLWEVRLAPL